MKLNEVLSAMNQPYEITTPFESEITGLAYDSRRVQPGDIFVAMRGEVTDGNRYIAQALSRGASVIVSEQEATGSVPWVKVTNARQALSSLSIAFYNDPSQRMALIGITGTNGKTTTSYLVESILRAAGEKVFLTGTICSRINGVEAQMAERTTPECSDLMALLDASLKQGCGYGVMEVSSHALDRLRVYGCKFRAALFTNLTRDHLDYHHDLESYFASKRKLFINPEGNYPQYSLINIDDPWGQRLAGEIRGSQLFTYGFDKRADFHVEHVDYDFNGIRLEARLAGKKLQLESHLPGKANVYNVLASAATAHVLSISEAAIKEGIAKLKSVPGRFETEQCGQPFAVIVDYAHTDDALKNLLQFIAELAKGQIITVFGCGGDRDKTKRPLMGEIAGQYSDLVVATSDNPRSEDPETILKEIEVGIKKTDVSYVLITDRGAAIKYALESAKPGDVVVLAGKGHETTQVSKGNVIPFDDKQVARECLNAMGYRLGPGSR